MNGQVVVADRFILLGASNLTRGIETVYRLARAAAPGPIDLLAAHGHGRSYGWRSRIFWRELPPIRSCGLWRHLTSRASSWGAAGTRGLLTDVGNDLVYGATPAQIAEWVDDCARRLADVCERLVITELPVASLRTLRPGRFVVMRGLLFPGCRLSLDDALRSAEQLNALVQQVAAAHRAALVTQPGDWFGFDPIHIQRRAGSHAWKKILAAWSDADLSCDEATSWRTWWTLRRLRPEARALYGLVQSQSQPAAIMPDGTRVSYF